MKKANSNPPDPYADYVDHPRFGRRPRLTGLKPGADQKGVFLHWNTHQHCIENTAIKADVTRQTPATVAATHYFDIDRKCRDCARRFIFFAEEQKHWYEELGFGLDSDCVRCPDCRKHQQGIARQREIYETLFHTADKTEEQVMQMAEICLSLIEAGVFTKKQIPHVRRLLNSVPENSVRSKPARSELLKRVLALESPPEESSNS